MGGNILRPEPGEFAIGPYHGGRHRKKFEVRPISAGDILVAPVTPKSTEYEHLDDETWSGSVIAARRLIIKGIPKGSITPEFVLALDPQDNLILKEAFRRQLDRIDPFRPEGPVGADDGSGDGSRDEAGGSLPDADGPDERGGPGDDAAGDPDVDEGRDGAKQKEKVT